MERRERLVAMIEEILPKFDKVAQSWTKGPVGNWRFQDKVSHSALQIEVCALVDYIYGDDHPTSGMIKSDINSSSLGNLRSAQGGLVGTAAAIRNGLLDDLQTQMLLDVQGDFIETARHSLANDAKDVAAVLLCVVLEDSVKRLASKNSLDRLLGKEFTIVVTELFKANVITKATKGVLLSHTDLRNAALHAQWDQVSVESVQSLLGFLPGFIEHHGI